MLKKAKEKTGLKGNGLAKLLGVTPATLYNWEKNDNWPSWSLKKCGFTIS